MGGNALGNSRDQRQQQYYQGQQQQGYQGRGQPPQQQGYYDRNGNYHYY